MANRRTEKPIAAALQAVGDPLRLLDGSEIPFAGAAPLCEMENVMELWNKFIEAPSIAHCYMSGFEEQREAFEELLYIASKKQISKEDLLRRITAGDYKEVYDYISRFCGFKPVKTDASEMAQTDESSDEA